MNPELTIASIGHYCGRYSEGFLGEPQNSISNIVFIIGAAYAWHVSRSTGFRSLNFPVICDVNVRLYAIFYV
jgi:hypothetical protein